MKKIRLTPQKMKALKKSSAQDKGGQEISKPVLYKCPFCEKSFADQGSYNGHVKTHCSKERSLKCSICEKEFKNCYKLKYHHEKIHLKIRSHFCTMCDKKYYRRFDLNYHMRTHTREKPYKCQICTADFTSCSNLKQHMASHSEDRNYICSVCGKTLKTIGYLHKHIKICNNVRTHKCSFCDKAFKTKANQRSHQNIVHSGDSPYKCSFCIKKFTTEDYKNQHEIIHANDIFYKCSFCEKTFRFKSNKYTHEKTHCVEKSLQLKTVCNNPSKVKADGKTSEGTQNKNKKSYKNPTKRSFAALEKTQNVEKSFRQKKVCNKPCIIETNAKIVELTLTSKIPKFPYNCSLCEKTFRFSSNKKIHEKYHKAEESLQSTSVKRTFAPRRIRNRRVARFHATNRFYSCTTCLKPLTTYEKLISHRLTHKKLRPCRVIVLRFA